MAKSWLVVANSAHARIFDVDLKKHSCKEIGQLKHSESRLRKRDLVSDRPGRTHDSTGGASHAIEQRLSPQEHEAELFGGLVAEHISAAKNTHGLEHLYLAAPPAFLGILRKSLDSNVHDILGKVTDKNLINEKAEDILAHFERTS